MSRKWNWWIVIAGLVAAGQAVFGFGNLIEDDGGPLYGRVVLLAVTVAGAGLIAAGILTRNRNRARGSALIGVGVLPSTAGVMLFWFPPVFLGGVLAIVVAVMAFQDAARDRQAPQDTTVATS